MHDAFALPPLVEIKPEDYLLAFTFPPYAKATYHVAMWAKENKAKVIAVTNSPISALGQIGDIVLLADSAGIGIQNSLVAPMAVANALLNTASYGSSAISSALPNRKPSHVVSANSKSRWNSLRGIS